MITMSRFIVLGICRMWGGKRISLLDTKLDEIIPSGYQSSELSFYHSHKNTQIMKFFMVIPINK